MIPLGRYARVVGRSRKLGASRGASECQTSCSLNKTATPSADKRNYRASGTSLGRLETIRSGKLGLACRPSIEQSHLSGTVHLSPHGKNSILKDRHIRSTGQRCRREAPTAIVPEAPCRYVYSTLPEPPHESRSRYLVVNGFFTTKPPGVDCRKRSPLTLTRPLPDTTPVIFIRSGGFSFFERFDCRLWPIHVPRPHLNCCVSVRRGPRNQPHISGIAGRDDGSVLWLRCLSISVFCRTPSHG